MTISHTLGLLLAAAIATTPAIANASPSSAPTCQAIGRAITAAYGPINSVTDNTAKVDALGSKAPYTVIRACDVHVPGHRLPLVVTIDAPIQRQFLESMAQFAGQMGHKAQKLDGAGYGDLAYLLPQLGGGYAVNALVGNKGLTVGNWASANDTKNMAKHIIALMQ